MHIVLQLWDIRVSYWCNTLSELLKFYALLGVILEWPVCQILGYTARVHIINIILFDYDDNLFEECSFSSLKTESAVTKKS
jgi:hypothetical protein